MLVIPAASRSLLLMYQITYLIITTRLTIQWLRKSLLLSVDFVTPSNQIFSSPHDFNILFQPSLPLAIPLYLYIRSSVRWQDFLHVSNSRSFIFFTLGHLYSQEKKSHLIGSPLLICIIVSLVACKTSIQDLTI